MKVAEAKRIIKARGWRLPKVGWEVYVEEHTDTWIPIRTNSYGTVIVDIRRVTYLQNNAGRYELMTESSEII